MKIYCYTFLKSGNQLRQRNINSVDSYFGSLVVGGGIGRIEFSIRSLNFCIANKLPMMSRHFLSPKELSDIEISKLRKVMGM
jgi:hypothetical protein